MIGRQTEQRLLRDLVERDEADFVVVYGRRRVGKTYLVRETFQGQFAFSYTGAAGIGNSVQLAEFTRALKNHGWLPAAPVANWFDAFAELRGYLSSLPADGPLVVFLDELPWMDAKRSDFVAALEHFWNGWASGVKRLTLIACGSATAWITKKIFRNKGGLYNRVARQIHLAPFTLAECREMLDAQGVVWSQRDIVEAYMVFGGVPHYLSLLDRRGSLAQNIDALCFEEDGPLTREFGQLFGTLFAHPDRHVEVLRALAAKQAGLTRDEIVAAVSFPDGGNLTRILAELQESGFIRRYHPFGRAKNGSVYQLTDPFTAFHLTFMEPGASRRFCSSFLDSAKHRAWSGFSFERVCLAHIPQISRALGIAGVTQDLSSWRSSGSPGAQVDLVIDRNDNVIDLCEMKYRNGPFTVDKKTDLELRAKAEAFRRDTATPKAVHLVLVTTYGLVQNSYASVFQNEVTMDDLFQRA
jgi:hypothetical protein